MAYQSELQLEEDLVKQLVNQGWQHAVIEDEAHLEYNFREQFNRFNARVLNGTPLSHDEFRRVLAHIKNRGVFESAKILRDGQLLTRDDGTTITYSLFNSKEWCKNRFQVAQQVKTSGDQWNNRYDVTLLMNGLPLIQIELKKAGVEVNKAFNQIKRYKEDNAYKGLFNFIQFFIISNGDYTRYFANDDKLLSSAFAFKWTDANNEPYKSLSDFATSFLDKCWSAKMIARYMIVQETGKRLIIMRPYQVYGAEKMVACAVETANNGFIWHTTGSGKTITSFKVSQLIAASNKFKKVIFLVDRRDLNKQTSDEFNNFQEGSISNSENTAELVANIKSTHVEKRLVLTTIQKLDKALKNKRYAADMDVLRDEKVAFIIDECHRTQFGEMQRLIRAHFTKAQYFGFTGTPRFVDNQSADGKTTADIFGTCLHTYLLKDGIKDKNTLAYSVEYVKTLSVKDDIEDPDWEVKGINTEEVWHNPTRIQKIVDDIIVDRKRKSHKKQFNAMLTVDSVKAVALYYDAFKFASKPLKKDERLVVATIYSYDENATLAPGQEHPKNSLARYMEDYNTTFGTHHSVQDTARYITDAGERFKNGQIDVLIVVDMMLTGFDSKILNTLYVDRNLEHHSLIQAYSRTNRVYDGPKPVGHIRCYRNLKEKTDAAVALFSNVANAHEVLALPYEAQKLEFEQALKAFLTKYPNPDDLHDLESETDKKEFVLSFRALAHALRKIETFSDFDYADFNIDQKTLQSYQSHYLDFKVKAQEGEQASILNDIDFELEKILTDVINVDYIYQLLATLDVNDEVAVKRIRDMVKDEGTENLRTKKDFILDFLDHVLPALTNDSNVLQELFDYLDEKVKEDISRNSQKFGISSEDMLSILAKYRFQNKFDGELFNQKTSLGFMQRIKLKPQMEAYVGSLAQVFETDS